MLATWLLPYEIFGLWRESTGIQYILLVLCQRLHSLTVVEAHFERKQIPLAGLYSGRVHSFDVSVLFFARLLVEPQIIEGPPTSTTERAAMQQQYWIRCEYETEVSFSRLRVSRAAVSCQCEFLRPVSKLVAPDA
jgi:hypothetical protein